MSVSAYHAMLLCAALTAVTSFEEKDIRCRHRDVLVPSFKICDGSPDCREIPRYSIHYGHYGDPEDEDRETCAPRHLLERTPQFTSLSHANGSLQFSWTWSIPPSSGLAGYYLSGTSPDHTFQTTLSPLLDRYTPGCLRGYTHYNITLRPFYVIDGLPKVGKATRLMVRSPSTDPGTPADIVRQSQSETTQDNAGELAVTIFEPTSWNSKPVGYRLRWEPNEQSSEPAKDFDLPVDAPDRKKDLNVTLPLKPGREYTLFARARGIGDFGEDLVGPETSVTMETAPVAPANLKAQTIDPTSAIISWHAASPVRRFVISRSFYATVKIPVPTSRVCDDDEDYYRACNDQPVHSDYREELRLETSTVILDGSTQESTSYSLPLLNLSSSAQHTVEVKACGATVCSSEATTVFTTPPSAIPTPLITTVLSNDTSSVYLEWNCSLPLRAPELSPEFEVRVKRNRSYRLIRTLEKAITIGNLSSGTEYEVQVALSMERTPGKREYGSPAVASISTWPLVPLAPTLSTKGFETAPKIAVVSWTFLNSTVTHIEVATNYSGWVNCENSTQCEVVVLHGWNSSFKAGFLRISELRPDTVFSLSVRGCNDLGCGDNGTVVISTDMAEPSEPTSLTVDAITNGSARLNWKAPEESGGPLSGYVVSWQCDQGHLMAATTHELFLVIPGFPAAAQECAFSVSAFNAASAERQLRGKSATLTTPWPPQK